MNFVIVRGGGGDKLLAFTLATTVQLTSVSQSVTEQHREEERYRFDRLIFADHVFSRNMSVILRQLPMSDRVLFTAASGDWCVRNVSTGVNFFVARL